MTDRDRTPTADDLDRAYQIGATARAHRRGTRPRDIVPPYGVSTPAGAAMIDAHRRGWHALDLADTPAVPDTGRTPHAPDAATRADAADDPTARRVPAHVAADATPDVPELTVTPHPRARDDVAQVDAAATTRARRAADLARAEDVPHWSALDPHGTPARDWLNGDSPDPITDPLHGATLTGLTDDDRRTMRDAALAVTAERIGVTPTDLARARALGAQGATTPGIGDTDGIHHGYGSAMSALTPTDRPHAPIRRALLRAAYRHAYADAQAAARHASAAATTADASAPLCAGCSTPLRKAAGLSWVMTCDHPTCPGNKVRQGLTGATARDLAAEAARARAAQDENDAARGLPTTLPPTNGCPSCHGPKACRWHPTPYAPTPEPYHAPDDALPDPADPLDVPDPTTLARATHGAVLARTEAGDFYVPAYPLADLPPHAPAGETAPADVPEPDRPADPLTPADVARDRAWEAARDALADALEARCPGTHTKCVGARVRALRPDPQPLAVSLGEPTTPVD